MLKVVVLDGGFGGELFADRLEEELPVVEVIRVIPWRNADDFLKSPHAARKAAMEALKSYIGSVDLIILANYLLSTTSLGYFRRKYKKQRFVGLTLPSLTTFVGRPTVVLTTTALAHTINYHTYCLRLRRKVATICLDSWPPLIDDGELTDAMIRTEFQRFFIKNHYYPEEIVLTCSQFHDISPSLRAILGHNLKIHDSTRDAISEITKLLGIRGGTGKKRAK